jgi:hypothetical protein
MYARWMRKIPSHVVAVMRWMIPVTRGPPKKRDTTGAHALSA